MLMLLFMLVRTRSAVAAPVLTRVCVGSGLVVFLYRGSVQQVASGFFVTGVFLSGFLKVGPFSSKHLESLQALSLSAQAVTLFYGLMLSVGHLQPPEGIGDHEAVVARWLVIVLNIAVFLLPALPFIPRCKTIRAWVRSLRSPHAAASESGHGHRSRSLAGASEVPTNLTLRTSSRRASGSLPGKVGAGPRGYLGEHMTSNRGSGRLVVVSLGEPELLLMPQSGGPVGPPRNGAPDDGAGINGTVLNRPQDLADAGSSISHLPLWRSPTQTSPVLLPTPVAVPEPPTLHSDIY